MAVVTHDEFGNTIGVPYARRTEDFLITKRISWAAVFAAVVVALVIGLVLNMIGMGFGFSVIDPLKGKTPSAMGFSVAAGIWMGVSTIVALFAGGWLAGHLAGIPRKLDGMLHGLLTWGLSTLLLVLFLATVFGSLLGNTLTVLGYGAAAVAPRVGDVASDRTGTPALTDKDIQVLINQLISEDNSKEALIDTVVARTQMSRAEATRLVEKTERETRVAVDKSAEALAHVMLWGALSLVLGAIAAGLGGDIGTPEPRHIAAGRAIEPQARR